MKNLHFKTLIILLILFNYDVALGQFFSNMMGLEIVKEYNGYQYLTVDVLTHPDYPIDLAHEKKLLDIRTERFLQEEIGWESRKFDLETTEGENLFTEFYETTAFAIELLSELIPILRNSGNELQGYAITCELSIFDTKIGGIGFIEKTNWVKIYNVSTWVVRPDDKVEEGLNECNETMLEYLLIDYYDGQD